jgi:hypothetical protein
MQIYNPIMKILMDPQTKLAQTINRPDGLPWKEVYTSAGSMFMIKEFFVDESNCIAFIEYQLLDEHWDITEVQTVDMKTCEEKIETGSEYKMRKGREQNSIMIGKTLAATKKLSEQHKDKGRYASLLIDKIIQAQKRIAYLNGLINAWILELGQMQKESRQ